MFEKLRDLGLSAIKAVESFIDGAANIKSTRLQRRIIGFVVLAFVMSTFLFLISSQ